MWFSDLCGLVRLPPGGTPAVVANPRRVWARKLVPDQQGGVWFSTDREPGGGHVAATGRRDAAQEQGLVRHAGRRGGARRQRLVRGRQVHPLRARARTGRSPRAATAIPAWHVGFDPAGGLWLGSLARLQHTTLDAPAGRCDDTPPSARIVPDPSKPVSLATLRRQGGFKITVREPFAIEGYVFDSDADESHRRRQPGRHRARRPHRAHRLPRGCSAGSRAHKRPAARRSPPTSATAKATTPASSTSCASSR